MVVECLAQPFSETKTSLEATPVVLGPLASNYHPRETNFAVVRNDLAAVELVDVLPSTDIERNIKSITI